MNSSIEETLTQRKSIYGEFNDQRLCVGEIVQIMIHCAKKNNVVLQPEIIAEWHYLAIKLARIAVNPDYLDNYHDLAGYAMLMEKERMK